MSLVTVFAFRVFDADSALSDRLIRRGAIRHGRGCPQVPVFPDSLIRLRVIDRIRGFCRGSTVSGWLVLSMVRGPLSGLAETQGFQAG